MAKRSFTPLIALPGGYTAEGAPPPGDPSRTLIEHTYATLRDDIVEGRLPPGGKLRIEHLRTQYQVGAGTLREAVTRLVSDALVTVEGQRGFRVAPIALEELQDITSLRVHIEIDALRQSIRAGDAQWRTALAEAFTALSAEEQPIAPPRRRQWEALNVRFHEALLSGHASPWTLRVLRLLSRHSERYRFCAMGLPGSVRDVHIEHTEIYELAMAGQDARAALALEAHIRATPDLLIKALREGRAFLPGTVQLMRS
ncbi:GntR family transcriptional regulator [Acidovorax sp. D2M1]|uniref:GntR family transcriptional regulator n=1 Tax=Acidovorax benzenivorans TaxID=2987520 RepID=A0ABT5S0X6_9BURK|nr:GntR family transcriptional regulator [Acidovorax benzenivorans]MDD2179305.1 GntR family transcriptional regulator [Acidovorax benzenivorans]